MKLRCWTCAVLSGLLLLIVMSSQLNAAEDFGFEPREFTGDDGAKLPYRLLLPQNYDKARSYPLVFFMHGAGERGTNNSAQLKNGVKVFGSKENREKYPCFVVAPQVPDGKMWVDTPWSLDKHTIPEKPTASLRLSIELLAALQKEFNIDAKRLYVAGVSMGGFGTWDAMSRWPQLWAAAAPVCGGADEQQAAKFVKIPVWTFHGDKDTVVKTSRSRNIVEALKKAGGTPRYTEYPGVGHDAWTPAFNDPELLQWLFAQKEN